MIICKNNYQSCVLDEIDVQFHVLADLPESLGSGQISVMKDKRITLVFHFMDLSVGTFRPAEYSDNYHFKYNQRNKVIAVIREDQNIFTYHSLFEFQSDPCNFLLKTLISVVKLFVKIDLTER